MNRLAIFLLLSAPALAQTNTVSVPVSIPVPAKSCKVGLFGGTCTVPAYTLTPTIQVTIPPQPLPTGPVTLKVTCGTVPVDATGKPDLSNMTCTATVVK